MTEHTYNFENYKMQEVFYEFYMSGKTGVIKVYFPLNIVKTVYFSEGDIVFATSNSEKDKLTNILIKNKKITKEQLNMALKQMDKSISLGRNLVNMGLITHKELVWAVKIQVLSIVYSIIMLKEGEYSVVEGFLPEGIIKLPFNTLKILFDSLILFKDKDWISEQISPDTVFVKTNLFNEYKEKISSDTSYSKIYDLIDGEKTVSEIAGMVDMEDFKVYKLFYALKFLKLIEEKDEFSEDLKIESEELYKIQNDDTESIKMVEDMVGEEHREEGIEIEFEGATSEDSIFEEESKIAESFEEEGMDSIVLDESDFEEEKKEQIEQSREDYTETGHIEGESFDHTVASDKEKALEDLQRQLEEEKIEFLDEDSVVEEEPADEKTLPVSSPYETAKQEISPGLGTFMEDRGEDSFIIEEEEISSKGSGVGLYVSVILILFIAALGFLGYRYYSASKTKKVARKVPQSVKIVKKSKDITAEDISIDNKTLASNNEISLSEIDSKLDENQNKALEPQKNQKVSEQNSNKTENEKAKQKESFSVTYEAVPVYEDDTSPKKKPNASVNNEVASSKLDEGAYTEYVLNSKEKLITNPEGYTIQLELACEQETLDKAISLLPDKDVIFFIPTKFRGRRCYLVCYGIFDTADEAKVTMQSLDEEFFKDNNPLIRQGKKFKRYFK